MVIVLEVMRMDNRKIIAMARYCSAWLNMASVAFVAIGVFQPEHMFGGLFGAVLCFLVGFTINYWSE